MDPFLKHHVDPTSTLATFLLERGADPNALNNMDLTPAEGVCESRNGDEEGERAFLGAAVATRPRDELAEAILRANAEHKDATTLLAKGRPRAEPLRRMTSPKRSSSSRLLLPSTPSSGFLGGSGEDDLMIGNMSVSRFTTERGGSPISARSTPQGSSLQAARAAARNMLR